MTTSSPSTVEPSRPEQPKPATQPEHHRLRTATTWASIVALLCAILLAALMLLPSLFGLERYVIVSGSMEPTIPTGAIVYDEVVPVADLKVGDVITFVPPPEYGITAPVTHRILEIKRAPADSSAPGEPLFRTKGDANDHPDAWEMVLDSDQQARVKFHLPYLGYVYIFLSNRWVQLLLIGLPALGIAAFLVIGLWRISGQAVREERDLGAQDEDAAPSEASGSRTEAGL